MLFTNSSAYKFADLKEDDLQSIRIKLIEKGKELGSKLCGTILLSFEGVNIRLSGNPELVKQMQQYLNEVDPNLNEIEFKDSYSERITLPRFLVKIKKEVISMGMEEVQPAKDGLLQHISPEEFKKWYDEEKDMIVLDTRNDYEVRLGTFEKAEDLNIKSFRSFPSECEKRFQNVSKEQPIVMFCTGGVRCEKASYCMKKNGFTNVYQLDGGILKYFERIGGEHYNGDCYIFDDRIALTPELKEANYQMCFQCRSPLTTEEMKEDTYIYEKQCKYCWNGKNDFRNITTS